MSFSTKPPIDDSLFCGKNVQVLQDEFGSLKLCRDSVWLFLGIFFIILGSRLIIFDYAGSPLPFFDQWVGEYDTLYLRLLDHLPLWKLIFVGHNEHRMVVTKALSFIGYYLNGYWDVNFLVVALAVVRAIEGTLLCILLASQLKSSQKYILFLYITFLFCWPISGYNLTSGFQVGLFLAEISVILAIFVFVNCRHVVLCPLALLGLYLLGLMSFTTALPMPGVLLVMHFLCPGERRWWWPLFVIQIFTGTFLIANKPSVYTMHVVAIEQVEFFLSLSAWPIGSWIIGALVILFYGGWLLNRIYSKKSSKLQVIAIGMFSYAIANIMMLAIFRGAQEFHMRHWDTAALTSIGLLALLGSIESYQPLLHRFVICVFVLFAVLSTIFVVRQSLLISIPYLEAAHNQREINVGYYRNKLVNRSFLEDNTTVYTAMRMDNLRFFDDPVLRYALYPDIPFKMLARYDQALAILSPEIIPDDSKKSYLSLSIFWLIRYGWVFVLVGLSFVFVQGARTLRFLKRK